MLCNTMLHSQVIILLWNGSRNSILVTYICRNIKGPARMPTISVGILCFNVVLMFCGLADVVRYMVIYRQSEQNNTLRTCRGCPTDGEDQANRSTLCGCVADGLRLVCCPCRGDADEKGQRQAMTFRRWYGRNRERKRCKDDPKEPTKSRGEI